MSNYEPLLDDSSIRRTIFWYLTPGTKVKLDIENDPMELIDWLENTVGKYSKDWDWKWYLNWDLTIKAPSMYYVIKIRKRRSHLISLLLLRFKT